MSDLIEVINSTTINAIYFGLIKSSYSYADIQKPDEILKLINVIKEYRLPKDILNFFSETYQTTCNTYPFWPRAALMETATFFMNDLCDPDSFDYSTYYNKVMNLPNIIESERDDHFWNWIEKFPYILKCILLDENFQEIDKCVEKWITANFETFEKKIDIIEQSLKELMDREGKEIQPIKVIISPLKCIYSADYQVSEGKLFVVLGDFIPHSIVHECVHPIVHSYIIDFNVDILKYFGRKIFNIDKSYYLNQDEDGFLNAFEENVVRRVTELIVNGEDNIIIKDILKDELSKA